MQNNMKNLVGRKLIALQNSFLGLTKGKEYEIIKQENDKFWIVTDKGTKEFTFLINSDLLKLVDKPKFKQGDKVLVSNNKSYWAEGEFITEYKDEFIVKTNVDIIGRKHIKPYEEEIKVGDWVKNTDEKELILVTKDMNLECLNNESEYIKITNPQLIELLNNEL